MSVGPNINVWTLGKGARGTWKLRYTTDSMEEAAECYTLLENEGKQVALGELGTFLQNGMATAGQVTFWWTANLNEYMAREPQDRGFGWADGFDTWVEYVFPQSTQIALPSVCAAPQLTAVARKPEERYAEATCDHCGKILPMNQLQRLTHEVRTGRSSGTSRTHRSTSSRYSGRGFSNGSTFGSSSSSGRTYYKEETLILCDNCYAAQVQADRGFVRVVWDFLNKL